MSGGSAGDEPVGGDALRLGSGSGQRYAEPGGAVDVVRVLEAALQGPGRPAVDWQPLDAEVVEEAERVSGGVGQGGVAAHGGQAQDVQVGRVERHHQREGVVGARVGVDDDLGQFRSACCP